MRSDDDDDDDDDDDGDDDDDDDDSRRKRLMKVLPFGGPGVFEPSSGAEAQFLHRRKILTVNGTHTTLAFLTLAAMEPPPHRGLPKNSYELAKAIVDDRDDDDPLMDDDFEDDGIDPEEMRVSSASGRGSFCGS